MALVASLVTLVAMADKQSGDESHDELLAANRANRAKAKDDAAAKEAKEQAKKDRVPRKLSASPTQRRVSASPRYTLIAVAALAAVFAILAAYFGYRYFDVRSKYDHGASSSSYASEAMDSARSYAATIATYDPKNYDDLDRRIKAISTPGFAESYAKQSTEARKGNTNANGSSKAESKYAGLQSLTKDTAVVLVTLDQTVTVPDLKSAVPDGIPYQSRVVLTLKRDGDRWLVADLQTV